MIPDANGKPESRSADAEQLAKVLEIELAQKKLEWAASAERYRKIRAASFLFLALIIMGALAAFFLLFSQLPANRPNPRAPAPGASP